MYLDPFTRDAPVPEPCPPPDPVDPIDPPCAPPPTCGVAGSAASRHLAMERFQYTQNRAYTEARAAMRATQCDTLTTVSELTRLMLEYAIQSHVATEQMRRNELQRYTTQREDYQRQISDLQDKLDEKNDTSAIQHTMVSMQATIRHVPPFYPRFQAYQESRAPLPYPAWVFDLCLEVPSAYACRVDELDAFWFPEKDCGAS